jgi:hypothetical protein
VTPNGKSEQLEEPELASWVLDGDGSPVVFAGGSVGGFVDDELSEENTGGPASTALHITQSYPASTEGLKQRSLVQIPGSS